MKKLTFAFSGLASSLLLNAGFEPFARKFDPVSRSATAAGFEMHSPSFSMPCQFSPKPALELH